MNTSLAAGAKKTLWSNVDIFLIIPNALMGPFSFVTYYSPV